VFTLERFLPVKCKESIYILLFASSCLKGYFPQKAIGR
jgi:hypothetical protein